MVAESAKIHQDWLCIKGKLLDLNALHISLYNE